MLLGKQCVAGKTTKTMFVLLKIPVDGLRGRERKAGGGDESSLGRQSKDSRAKKKKNGKTRRTEKRKIFFRISSADLILSLPGPAGSLLKVGRDKGKTGS